MTAHDASRPSPTTLDLPVPPGGLSLREILEALPPDTLLPVWWIAELLARSDKSDEVGRDALRTEECGDLPR